MAPRPIVPPQPRGGPVAAVKQRAALGDKENAVYHRCAERKGETQISRPITRSFGAQLIANARAEGPKKKPLAAAAPVANGLEKVVRKKVTGKIKLDNAKQITSNVNEECEEKSVRKRSLKDPSRKKVPTLTSVLTTRSKHACGISEKQKQNDHDIDRLDTNDQLAVIEYVEDIYKFYRLAEASSQVPDYMNSQPEINARMRGILADWLVEVHLKFELMPETLYLTMHVIDRYLSCTTVCRRDLQLVGVTAMLVACKYEEIWAPEIDDFVHITDKAYTREQIIATEKSILNCLEWSLTVPTPYVFLLRFLKAAGSDTQMENLAFFFTELSLIQYFMATYCPSMLAASAVYAARCTIDKGPHWTETLKMHTGYSQQQLRECANHMMQFRANAATSKLQVVYKKYSDPQLGSVAFLPPIQASCPAQKE